MIRLHLGSGEKHRIKGFTNIDLQRYKNTDIVCDISKLPYRNGEVSEIYASHCLEHFRHTETLKVLKEWYRVLKKGGKLFCAVPDFDAIVNAYLNTRTFADRIIYILYGSQHNKYTIHYVTFTVGTLMRVINKAGFTEVKKVDKFPYGLKDCSTIQYHQFRISGSLNVIATK
jgi:predicted SAM-dependent methyltransferase